MYESKATSPSDGPEDTYSDRLQFVPQEEGRIRYVPGNGFSTASQPKFAYDYFLKDHLGNVRAVITEGNSAATAKDRYKATYEPGADSAETALFGSQEGVEYGRASVTTPQLVECTDCAVPQNTPNTTLNYNDPNIYDSTQSNVPSEKVAKLNGSSKKIGTSLILKVMAGDHFDLSVKAWFPDKESASAKAPEEDVLQTLLNTLSGNASSIPGNHTAEEIGGTTSPLLPGLLSFLQSHPDSAGDPKDPAAYINWVLFDENFHYVPEGSGFKKVESYTTDMQLLQQDSTEVPKNGFLFVYLSNETQHYDIFFDDMLVNYSPGPLLEETHYYPFGLTMSGISSQAVGGVENRYKFNGIELNNEFDLNTYEAYYRRNDPQIGRWQSIDTRPDFEISPYASMANNPILYTDFLGDTTQYYNIANGDLLGTINNEGAMSRVKINAKAYNTTTTAAGLAGFDLKKQGIANVFVSTLNETLTALDNLAGCNLISFETTERSLEFDGGSLNELSYFDDNSTLTINSTPASSGILNSNGEYTYDPLPNGDYGVTNGRQRGRGEANGGFYRDGVAFTFDVNPNFTQRNGQQMQRTELRIHPDGNRPGSAGCVALATDRANLQAFYNRTNTYIQQHGNIQLNVTDPNNPNVMYNRHAADGQRAGE